MKLYFAAGACSFAPHIALQELGLPYELVRVNNRTKRTSEGGDFWTVNPKGYVAALRLDCGATLTEAPAILQFLADLKPEAGLAPPNGELERVRLQEWLNFIASELHAGSSPLFDQALPKAAREFFEARLFKRFDWLDSALSDRPFLMGGVFTVADAYLFTVLGWMPRFSIDLGRWPKIGAYVVRIAARASVEAARAREAAIPAVE